MNEAILFIGATGTLGLPVVNCLQAEGFQVRIMSRNRQKAVDQFGSGFEIVTGDVFDRETLDNALRDCSAVHISVATDREHEAVCNIVEAANQQSIKRISYISGATALEQNCWFPMTQQKCQAEKTIRESGIPYTIFCPTWFMEMLPRFVRDNRAAVLGKQPNPFHWIAVEDFAGMVSKAYTVDEAINQRFTIYGPEALCMREALERYCAALHPDIRAVTTMPLWLARTIARVTRNDDLGRAANLMAYFEKVSEGGDPSEANRILGAPQTTLDQWLRQRKAIQA